MTPAIKATTKIDITQTSSGTSTTKPSIPSTLKKSTIETTKQTQNTPTSITQSKISSVLSPSITPTPTIILETSTVYETKTIETTRLRTYTFIVTRVHDNEQIVTSTTEVRPQVKTLTVTDSSYVTRTVTLTDPNSSLTSTVPYDVPNNDKNIGEL